MKIMNVAAEDIQACAQFEYKTWTVSFSTIFKNSSVLVFKDDVEFEANSVERAIALIDKLMG